MLKPDKLLKTSNDRVNSMIFMDNDLPDSNLIIGSLNKIEICDLNQNEIISCFSVQEGDRNHCSYVYSMVISNDKKYLISSSDEGEMFMWDLEEKKKIEELKGHTSDVLCLILSPYGNLISGSADNSIRIWDLPKLKCLNVLETSAVVYSLIFEKGQNLISGDHEGINIWDIGKGDVKTIKLPYVSALLQMNKDQVVIGMYDDPIIRILNVITLKCSKIRVFGKGEGIQSMKLLKEGFLACCSWNNSDVKIVSIKKKEVICELKGHKSEGIYSLVVTKDGNLVSGGVDEIIQWQTKDWLNKFEFDNLKTTLEQQEKEIAELKETVKKYDERFVKLEEIVEKLQK